MSEHKYQIRGKAYFITRNPETGEITNKVDIDDLQIHSLPSTDDPVKTFKSIKFEPPTVSWMFTLSGEQAKRFWRIFFPTPLEQLIQRITRWFSQN